MHDEQMMKIEGKRGGTFFNGISVSLEIRGTKKIAMIINDLLCGY